MEIKIFFLLLAAYAKVLVCADNYPRREEFRVSIEDYEPESSDPESHKGYGRVIKVRRDKEESRETENSPDVTELMDESQQKILAFGKRVFESVKEHGILEDQANLIASGDFRIDWWKNDRRLAKIRKRLYKELARMPDLNDHLRRLGWRNTSKDFISRQKSQSPIIEYRRSMAETRDPFINKILKLSFDQSVDIDVSESGEETIDNVPIMFIYIKLMLSKAKMINRLDPTVDVPESPTKFSLDITESQDLETSDVDVLDIETHSVPISNPIESSLIAMNSEDDSIDTDRVLQLIPLVVDELRKGRFSKEERRSLGWIFGKRLWPLLERDAWKNADDKMDEDLAAFLVKGKLPERESERPKRRSRKSGSWQWDNLSEGRIHAPVTKSDGGWKERYIDYVFRSSNKNYDMEKSKNVPFFNFYRNNDHENSDNLLNSELTNLATFFGRKKSARENEEEEARYGIEENSLELMDEYESYYFEYFYL